MPSPADTAIRFALAQVGKPYQWGATGPNSYDCSGLVMMAYRSAGVNLPRTTGLMINSGYSVNKSQLAPGDLVFPDPGHVQIYIGNGNVVEAPHTGAFVRVVPMWGFWRARRVAVPAVQNADWIIPNIPGLPNIPIPVPGNGGPLGLGSLVTLFTSWDKIAVFLTNPANYLRIGMFIVGFAFILLTLFDISKMPSMVRKVAG